MMLRVEARDGGESSGWPKHEQAMGMSRETAQRRTVVKQRHRKRAKNEPRREVRGMRSRQAARISSQGSV